MTKRKNEAEYWNLPPVALSVAMCMFCRHLKRNAKCKAYPEGIPSKILNREEDHIEPFEGDNGIQFELHPEMTPTEDILRRMKK